MSEEDDTVQTIIADRFRDVYGDDAWGFDETAEEALAELDRAGYAIVKVGDVPPWMERVTIDEPTGEGSIRDKDGVDITSPYVEDFRFWIKTEDKFKDNADG